jgi:hypothetical protein
MNKEEIKCKHCGEPIGEITEYGGKHGWTHHYDDGPDAYSYCKCCCLACEAWKTGGQAAYGAVVLISELEGCCDGEEAEPENSNA